ncbi:hypothetical protein ES332_A03G110700v1 [Gossypium tomentosum]|uniref:Uncharacterized protein n=1 Tax=Gossypium tomentosum TaxID=34277 RepID=A0A5D2R531_GOSTO|nr:hypothetical protein ES332_A03G110700v1 [Gossypium tomentosum]
MTNKIFSYAIFDVNTRNITNALQVPMGPITRSRVKGLREAINGLVTDIWAKCDYSVSQFGPNCELNPCNLFKVNP